MFAHSFSIKTPVTAVLNPRFTLTVELLIHNNFPALFFSNKIYFKLFLSVWIAAMKMQINIFVLNALLVRAIKIIKYIFLFMEFSIVNVGIMKVMRID